MVTRSKRRAFAVAVTALAILGVAPTAHGAGTGGIEATPVPAVVDGKQVTAFHTTLPSSGTTSVRFALRNITTEARSARVYAAAARPDGQGGFQVLGAGSSPHVRLLDRSVRLAAKETRSETFEVVAPDGEHPGDTVYAAVVIEVQQGAVVQRAATLVYLEPGERARLPRWAVYVAVAALVAVGGALLTAVVGRRRRLRC